MEHLRNLIQHFKEQMPEAKFPKASDELFVHIEKELLPHLMKIMKKDNTLFTDKDMAPELFPGITVKWDGSETSWQKLRMALLYAVLHGNPKEKFGAIFEQIKGALPGGRQDEVMAIVYKKAIQGYIDSGACSEYKADAEAYREIVAGVKAQSNQTNDPMVFHLSVGELVTEIVDRKQIQ